MIQVNELRIGNWVQNDGDFLLVRGIDSKYAYVDTNDKKDLYQHRKYLTSIEPIPLTEEILLKCGFIMSEHGEYYQEENEDSFDNVMSTKLTYNLTDELFTVVNTDYDGYHIDCKYLHTLQNLWNALTNQELNIEL